MSREVDERVVSMQFDNRNFENNANTSLGTLAKLKQALSFNGATKGLESVESAANKVNMHGLGSAVETIQAKFSAMQVMGVTALANITNSAVNAGKRIVSALTIDPIKMGFKEYETQINAVQTIMANTSSKGTTLDDVNKALDTLNTYADKTIYNFTEMTRNIGTFTAAGVDLDTSVKSIQGIANLAAVSGSTSQQASNAMYQLSQALAAGRVSLMDWNSVVNAGMGGQVFQDALKRTATAMGTNVDAIIKKYGSFRESLTQGEWLTTDVLTKTLEQFTMAAEEGSEEWNNFKKSLMEEGYTEKQAVEILKMANTATNAATKVKTFTQLWDTLKEAAQSGWTQTWEIIIGDFEEAKELLTSVSDVIGNMLNESAKARNELLQGWKDMGGRADLIKGISNIFQGLLNIVKPIKEAFTEIFPPATKEQLWNITYGFRELTRQFRKFTGEHSDEIKATFKGIFSVASVVAKVIGAVALAIGKLLTSKGVASLVSVFLDITAAIGNFFTSITEGFNSGGLTGFLSKIVSSISDVLGVTAGGIQGLGDILVSAGKVIAKAAGYIWDAIKPVFTWIADNVSVGDIFAGLAGGGIFVAAKKFAGVFSFIKETLEGFFGKGKGDKEEGLKEKFSNILDSVHGSLESFTTGLKVGSIVAVAVAVGILSAALNSVAKLKVTDISKGLFAIGAMLAMLTDAFKSMSLTLTLFDTKGIVKSSFALILMAKAVDILGDAMIKLSDLSLGQIAKGLIAVGGGIVELGLGLKIIGKTKISLKTSVAMLALAQSCKILGDALGKFGSMSWDEIKRGLTGMGGALGELVVALAVLGKVGGFSSLLGSVGILIAVQSLGEMAESLKSFGEMSWDEIGRGLAAMGGALAELTIVLGILSKIPSTSITSSAAGGIFGKKGIFAKTKSFSANFSGLASVFSAGAIWIAIQGLKDLAIGLSEFSKMSWGEIARGLTGMGGALAEVGLVLGLLGKFAGFSSIFAAGAILIVVQGLGDMADAFRKFGSMTWDEIERGLIGMFDALFVVAGFTGALGIIAGFSGLLGAGAILMVIQGLGDMADAMKKFGEMTWEEIGRGLVGMGGALLEISLMSGALGMLTGFAGLLGGGAILLVVQGLGDIADAMKKFSEMSWEEISKGVVAMGLALAEIGAGTFLNTLGIIGAASIEKVAEPLGVLADSVKKWADVTVPENLGAQLVMLADGVFAFTFGGSGASAIAEVAAPLGTMADSVRKWQGVVLPEALPSQLTSLAGGVKAFTFGGLGASAIAELASPLGTLAGSVSKWSGVTIPEGMGDKLKDLAGGVKAFSFAFAAGWSMTTLIGPLGDLAGEVKKWNGVTIPNNLSEKLSDLAEGIGSFSFSFAAGWSISTLIGPLGDLAGEVKKWNGVTIASGFGDRLKDFKSGVDAVLNVDTTNLETFKSLSDIVDSVADSISESISKFSDAGKNVMTALAEAVESKVSTVADVMIEPITTSLSTISGYSGSFYDAGVQLAVGFGNGISAWTWYAAAMAAAMAAAANAAARAALGIHSPSKVFYEIGEFSGEGLVNALYDYRKKTYVAGSAIADSARKGLRNAIGKVDDLIGSDVNTQPTIRPVLDLSDVKSGAGSISGLFNMSPSIGVSSNIRAISSTMSQRNQNGTTNDVVSAINRLRKDIGNVGGTTNNIVNGVTYDDGSNIADAIKVLVRATRVEGRA